MPIPVINNPCPEKWDEMTSDNQGRFCNKCAKIVIDFTKKSTQEIIDFLSGHKGEDICGKLGKPALIPVRVSKTMKLFTAALFLTFGSLLFTSCGPTEDEQPVGKVALDSTEAAENQYYLDSMTRADSIAKSAVLKDTSGIDSAEIMSTVNVLDSIMNLKNK